MTEKDFLKIYDKINFGTNSICAKCRENNKNLSMPVSIWQYGSKFDESRYRVLFVGKNARGNPGTVNKSYIDSTKRADEIHSINRWAYWNYTNEIASALYAENAWEQIAFTNIVKCNNSGTTDTTTEDMKTNCILRLGVIRTELEAINPNNVIFYTGYDYDDYIEKIFDNTEDVENKTVKIGSKNMPFHSFFGYINNKKINCLRIGHPERMKKSEYVSLVVNWIKSNVV